MKKIFFLIIFLGIFAACGGAEIYEPYEFYADEPEYEPEFLPEIAPPTARVLPDDGVLRLHSRVPVTLNPLLNEDVTVARVLRLIFEPLAVLDEEFRVVGYLAELEFASDFSGVNATIRENAIFSDGKPVTADDVIFSIEFMRAAPASAIYRANAEQIADAVRIDARTVQIFFERASVMSAYSLNFPIIPRHFYENETNPQSPANLNPLGSGAFMFESLSPTRAMTLRRNPYNWRGRTQIDAAEIIFLPNAETDFYAFERGRIDALELPLTEWTRRHGVRSPNYSTFPAMYFEFIGFNPRRAGFRDIYTRRGIAHAFNACEAVAELFLAHATRAVTPVHPYNWAADASVSAPIYDPARAAALLGTVRADAPLVILANAENSQRVSIAARLADSLSNAGLSAVAEILPSEEYFARLAAYDFDLFVGGMELPFAPDVRVFFGGGLFPFCPVLEAAFAAVEIASTEAAYIEAVSRLQAAFAEQLPVIGLAFTHSAVLTGPRLSGDLSPAPGDIFSNVREWKVGVR